MSPQVRLDITDICEAVSTRRTGWIFMLAVTNFPRSTAVIRKAAASPNEWTIAWSLAGLAWLGWHKEALETSWSGRNIPCVQQYDIFALMGANRKTFENVRLHSACKAKGLGRPKLFTCILPLSWRGWFHSVNRVVTYGKSQESCLGRCTRRCGSLNHIWLGLAKFVWGIWREVWLASGNLGFFGNSRTICV